MEVKVTCPKCGQSASMPSKQVVRKFRCAKCSHRFVPAREGISCPKCDSVTIISNAKRRHRITCLNCSHVIRKPRRWEKRRYQALIVLGAVVLVLLIFMLVRWRSNVALAKEIRVEYKTWLAALPRVPDSENGMLVIMEGLSIFDNYYEDMIRVYEEDFSLENESDRTLVQKYLAEREQALEKIYKGLKYEKFALVTDYGKEWDDSIGESLTQIRNAAFTLVLKGELREHEGEKSEALEIYLNALRLGGTPSGDRWLISRMMETAIVGTCLKPIIRALSESQIAEKDLQCTLETLIEQYGKRGDFFSMMEMEYNTFLLFVADMIEGEKQLDDLVGGKFHWLTYLLVSKFIHNYRRDVETYRRALEIWRKVEPARYYNLPPEAINRNILLQKIGVPSEKEMSLVLRLAMPTSANAVKALVESEVFWRGAIALAAIRFFEARNGRLPKNLAELDEFVPKDLLIDPFSGNNLIYRVSGNDFYLYSVGHDGVDGKPVNVSPYFVKGEPHPGIAPDTIFHAPAAVENGK